MPSMSPSLHVEESFGRTSMEGALDEVFDVVVPLLSLEGSSALNSSLVASLQNMRSLLIIGPTTLDTVQEITGDAVTTAYNQGRQLEPLRSSTMPR